MNDQEIRENNTKILKKLSYEEFHALAIAPLPSITRMTYSRASAGSYMRLDYKVSEKGFMIK